MQTHFLGIPPFIQSVPVVQWRKRQAEGYENDVPQHEGALPLNLGLDAHVVQDRLLALRMRQMQSNTLAARHTFCSWSRVTSGMERLSETLWEMISERIHARAQTHTK